MGPFEMVVLIVAITVIGGLFREYIKKIDVKNSDIESLQNRLTKLESLETRVETLEKIVTDKKQDLKREIDAL